MEVSAISRGSQYTALHALNNKGAVKNSSGDGLFTKENVSKTVAEIARELADGKGYVDTAEHDNLKDLDLNGDGKLVGQREFNNAVNEVTTSLAAANAHSTNSFREATGNLPSDGTLSEGEVADILAKIAREHANGSGEFALDGLPPGVKEALQDYDLDGSGTLSGLEEFNKVVDHVHGDLLNAANAQDLQTVRETSAPSPADKGQLADILAKIAREHANGSGEFALDGLPPGVKEALQDYDLDGSGTLSGLEEFNKVVDHVHGDLLNAANAQTAQVVRDTSLPSASDNNHITKEEVAAVVNEIARSLANGTGEVAYSDLPPLVKEALEGYAGADEFFNNPAEIEAVIDHVFKDIQKAQGVQNVREASVPTSQETGYSNLADAVKSIVTEAARYLADGTGSVTIADQPQAIQHALAALDLDDDGFLAGKEEVNFAVDYFTSLLTNNHDSQSIREAFNTLS